MLTKGKKAKVDDADYIALSKSKWCVDGGNYAIGMVDGRLVRMHRHLLRAKPGQVVDHVNRDRLDNRRSNLRFVTMQQSALNSGLRKDNKSGHRGVSKNSLHGHWIAQIVVNGKTKHLGSFRSKREAVAARKTAEKTYFDPDFYPQNYGRILRPLPRKA